MSKKLKADILSSLSNTHRSQFDERRKYEWKVFFTTLGIYTAVLGAKFTGKIPNTLLESKSFVIWVCHLSPIPTLASSIYLGFIHRANKINQDFAHVAENHLMKMSQFEKFKKVKKKIPKFATTYWSLIWQIVILSLVAIITTLLMVSV